MGIGVLLIVALSILILDCVFFLYNTGAIRNDVLEDGFIADPPMSLSGVKP